MTKRTLQVFAATLSLLFVQAASASVIDLGAAAGYSVLTFNGNNTSDSAIQGGPIGVVQGNWTQSGGQQTNNQQPTTVFLSPGFKNNGPSVETTVFDAARLNSAWSAATSASASASEAASSTYAPPLLSVNGPHSVSWPRARNSSRYV